jgi:hypothetical protein
MSLASCNGLTVLIDDGVPTKANDEAAGAVDYTTYLLGAGVLRTAPGPVDTPVEVERDAKKNGGQDTLIQRIRETIHPNGFSWSGTMATASPTDTEMLKAAAWALKFDPKAIPMVRVITNG